MKKAGVFWLGVGMIAVAVIGMSALVITSRDEPRPEMPCVQVAAPDAPGWTEPDVLCFNDGDSVFYRLGVGGDLYEAKPCNQRQDDGD